MTWAMRAPCSGQRVHLTLLQACAAAAFFDNKLSLEFEERQRALVAVLKPHIDI
jgi:hypothetical protein